MLADDRLVGRAQGRRGLGLYTAGRLDEALEAYDVAITLSAGAGDLDTLMLALNNSAHVWEARGDSDKSMNLAQRALDIARRMGNPGNIASQLAYLSFTEFCRGNFAASRPYLAEGLEVSRRSAATTHAFP